MPHAGEQAASGLALDAANHAGQVLSALRSTPRDRPWVGCCYSDQPGVQVTGELGMDLYDGLAGLALFFSALSAQTGASPFDELAALSCARLREAGEDGGYRHQVLGLGGLAGISFAALHAWLLTGDEDALDVVRAATSHLVARTKVRERAVEIDLLGGEAGALLAVVALIEADLFAGDDLVDTAGALARLLVGSMQPAAPTGRAWPIFAEGYHLVGAGHGTSGAIWALHRARPLVEGRVGGIGDAIDEALAFEDASFDRHLANWVDPRCAGDRVQMNTWCYGAAGVRLVRGSMGRLPPDGCVQPWELDHKPVDHLCCGAAGRHEAAAVARQPEAGAMATALAECVLAGTARVELVDDDPTTSTSLFRGLSGVGYSLLRVADPALPSVLLLSSG